MDLRRLRRERAMTQEDLAERSGLARRTIVSVERGEREPHPSTVRKLAAALGVDVMELTREGRDGR